MLDSTDANSNDLIPVRGKRPPRSKETSDKKPKLANLRLDQLQYFESHPFKLYEGERLDDMVNSIKQIGVIQSICVRGIEGGKYEILSGHNRVNASREAGLDSIPALIYENMSDEDAEIFVVESNFNQRSAKELKPSELAKSLHMLNEAFKKKSGFRSDLEDTAEDTNGDSRLRTMNFIGRKHGLSQATIARYIRIAYLIKGLQEELDNKKIGLCVAEQLSYLKEPEQKIVETLIESDTRINIEQAKALRRGSESSDGNVLNEEEIKKILGSGKHGVKAPSINLDKKFLAQFFDDKQSEEDILDTIAKALELYRSGRNLINK